MTAGGISVVKILGILYSQARGDKRELQSEDLKQADVEGSSWMELPASGSCDVTGFVFTDV